MNDEQRYKQGIEVRTEVLGEKHVGRSLQNLSASSLVRYFRFEFITKIDVKNFRAI